MGVICSAWVRERGERLSSAKMTGPTLIPSLVTYIRLGKELAISSLCLRALIQWGKGCSRGGPLVLIPFLLWWGFLAVHWLLLGHIQLGCNVVGLVLGALGLQMREGLGLFPCGVYDQRLFLCPGLQAGGADWFVVSLVWGELPSARVLGYLFLAWSHVDARQLYLGEIGGKESPALLWLLVRLYLQLVIWFGVLSFTLTCCLMYCWCFSRLNIINIKLAFLSCNWLFTVSYCKQGEPEIKLRISFFFLSKFSICCRILKQIMALEFKIHYVFS